MRIGFTEKLHQNAPDPTQFQNCFLLRLQEREENQQEMTIMNYLKTPCVTCLFNFPPNLPNSNLSFALLLQRLPLSLFPFSLALLSFQTLLSQSRTLRFTFLSIWNPHFRSLQFAMKHFMQPRNTILREATEPTSSPNPSYGKPRPPRKPKASKENAPPSDPNSMTSDSKPSPAAKLKSPLPPRPPPSNPLKRKLSVDSQTENSVPGTSDSGVQVLSHF